MSKEAMKLALEALEAGEYYIDDLEAIVYAADDLGTHEDRAKMQSAITALREALAEQPAQQEPVVWMYQDKSTHEVKFQKHMRGFVDHGATYETPLYITPPQRTWVGLTDEDIRQCSRDVVAGGPENSVDRFAYAIEAKLKEKNK